MIDLLFADPIPVIHRHYEKQLHDVFADGGGSATRADWSRPVEGMPGLAGKVRMLFNAIHNIRRQRVEERPILQVWPSLGLLEARLWSSSRGRRYVMLHDPAPLRRQYGHSRASRRWASAASAAVRPTILVSNDHALRVARRELPHHRIEQVLHPILGTQRHFTKSERPSVVVAGQFKPARDVEMLASLGPRLRALGWEATIAGRGWPDVDGWTVDDRFLDESELEALLGRAWVHLLPYRNYFQSGVTLRALEMSTPTVGDDTDFLRGLFGESYAGLVDPASGADGYLDALASVVSGLERPLADIHSDYFERSRDSWEVVR